MGPTLSALVGLQSIERDLSKLRRRQRVKRNAVAIHESRIAEHTEQRNALHDACMEKRKQADGFELNLREAEDRISTLRVALNSAKTNKEYAALLTEINTHKADNARQEEEGLKIITEVDEIKAQIEEIDKQIADEQKLLEDIKASNAEELDKLDKMIAELMAKRVDAAKAIPTETLTIFERLATQYDGEAMADVEQTGRGPHYTYTCGGCFMSLNAEHANALRSKDQIRQCDNCQRILYITNMHDE
ncbi:MAG: hypothetical protein K8S55_05225 [Phycisphaerae bacterium]|nr:hypothetical protein [Phycisphaerae bacterium]